MRKAALILITLLVSIPLFADERHQSYIAFDDGGTIVKQSDDGREVEGRVNMPVYPGDEVVTNRRGRAEVRLSDGNVIGIDRATAIQFRSILDSYEGESSQTVAELRFGKVAVHRTELGRDVVRLDTSHASYVAREQAVYSVETDSRGKDRVTVFDGTIEVRTRSRATRLRAGEGAEVDDRGVYDLVSDSITAADDFERWFLKRAERRDGRSKNNRYLDKRLAYWADDLDDHGNWVNIAGIGWTWRPYVGVGWRPYHHGYWHTSRNGCLTWVSYDPFGWAPYHYGRWAYDNFHGWIWVPGYGYSPAWVYWWYSPGYIGWAPAGWWDCHRDYYDWAYRPYSRAGLDIGFGFNGRVRIDEIDLRPWTFIDANNIISNRVDRAALTIDVARQRLGRGAGAIATVSSDPARFTREEFRNPAAAINRRIAGGTGGRDTGASGGSTVDVTPFIRRDNGLNASVRERVVRNRLGGGGGGETSPSAGGTPVRAGGAGGGGLAPVGGGTSVAPVGRGGVAPIGGGAVAPIGGGSGSGIPTPAEGRVNRGGTGTGSGSTGNSGNENWRGSRGETGGRINRGGSEPGSTTRRPSEVATPAEPSTRGNDDNNTIGRHVERVAPPQQSEPVRREQPEPAREQPEPRQNDTPPPSRNDHSWRDRSAETASGSNVPRRVIERSAGTRLTPSTGDSGSSSSGSKDTSARSGSTRSGSGRVYVPRSDSGSRSSGSSSSGSSAGSSRSSGSGSSSSGSSKSSDSSGSSSRGSGSSGSNRSEGGSIKRGND
jgi:FecR protein